MERLLSRSFFGRADCIHRYGSGLFTAPDNFDTVVLQIRGSPVRVVSESSPDDGSTTKTRHFAPADPRAVAGVAKNEEYV